MTAQEAAKGSLDWLKHYRWAVLWVAIGGCMAFVGLSYDDLAKLQATGAGSAIWGFVLWLVERSSKRTGAEVSQKLDSVVPDVAEHVSRGVADEVVERIFTKFGGLEQTIKDSDKRRDQMHAENKNDSRMIGAEVHQIKEQLDDHAGAIVYIGDHLAKSDGSFKLPQLKKPKPQ